MEPKQVLELIRRAQAGDASAFEDLINAHARLVWASVYPAVRDRTWAEDLVQETFTRAWESITELREPEAFRGWLLMIARRLAWRQAEIAGRTEFQPRVPDRESAVSSEDPEEAREEVQNALARLPDRYRVPVTLRVLDKLEYDKIEQMTGIANGSLRGLVARGVAKLRTELSPWWRKRHAGS